MHTRDTAVWVHSMPRCAKIHYRTCTHTTCFGKSVGFPVPVPNPIANRIWCVLKDRDCHRYGKTCGFEVMGFVGTGTVVNFSTPRHTIYPYHSIAGISQVYYNKVCIILLFWNLFFLILNHCFLSKFTVWHVTEQNMAVSHAYTFVKPLSPLAPTPISLQKIL